MMSTPAPRSTDGSIISCREMEREAVDQGEMLHTVPEAQILFENFQKLLTPKILLWKEMLKCIIFLVGCGFI